LPGSAILRPINADWFKSDLTMEVAQQFNGLCGSTPAARFFAEMMLHRLRLHDTTNHSDGYTVTRHAEDLPEAIRRDPQARHRKMLEIMRQDYEAIFHAAKATQVTADKKPSFDTTIFRDLELWADGVYWHSNRALADGTRLRRLFFYEDRMCQLDANGQMAQEHTEELLGLFTGTMIHRSESWDYNVLNIGDLRTDETRAHLLGTEWASGETQSSAVFDGHTVVFIRLSNDNTVLVHRFFSDQPGYGLGKVKNFSHAFEEAFMVDRRPKGPDVLRDHLCELHREMATRIKAIYGQAEQQMAVYEKTKRAG
jgi:hypothetical protein